MVCKLDHTFQTRPSNDADRTTPKAMGTSSGPSHNPSYERSPLKKVHLQGSSDGGAEVTNQAPLLPRVARVTHRSYSSPASIEPGTRDDTRGRTGIENPDELRSNTAPVDSTPDSRVGSNPFLPYQQFSGDLAQNLPASFDFSSQTSHNASSMSSTSEEFHTPEGGSSPQDEKGGMFVFSASSPVLHRKRRNAAEALTPPPIVLPLDRKGEGIGVGPHVEGNEATSREVALLTQQLELTSDDVS